MTEDVVRSLIISQRLLGTNEIMLIHHTDCGMLTFTDDDVKAAIAEEVGIRPPFALEAFADVDDDVRQSIARIQASPFLLHKVVRASSTRSKRGPSERSGDPGDPFRPISTPATLLHAGQHRLGLPLDPV